MKLKTWRENQNLKQVELAAKLGCTAATISRIEAGKFRPDWPLLARIAELSDGAVTANDFMPVAA